MVGTMGMFLILAAFAGDLFKKITEDDKIYNILNIAGGLFLAYYAYTLNSLPFLILQMIWVLFATYKLITICKNVKK